jgi:1,2-diacylglycerol 3-alpha-glucosyltransferase
MKSKINLVILTQGFASGEADSTAFPYLQLYLGKLKSVYNDIDVHIISFHYPLKTSEYNWHGIHVFAAGGTRIKLMKPYLWIRILIYLFKLRKNKGIDIIHSFWLTETTLVGLLFRQLTGVPLIATAMGQDVKKRNRYQWLLRFFKFDLITLSEFQVNFLNRKLRNNHLKVIPFGIDLSNFKQKSEIRPIDILAVGSLNKIKNYSDFIEIIRSLVNIFPVLSCGIVGDGREKKQIEKLMMSYGLDKHIKLFGHLEYDNVIKKMQESRILLHTSVFEGQGLIFSEALAAGAYIVSYPVGTVWNIVNKKVKTGMTKEELEHHVINILSDKKTDNTRVLLCNNEETSNEYNEIYRSLIKGK